MGFKQWLMDGPVDWLKYCWEEFRNVDRDKSWREEEMTRLVKAQKGTVEERQIAARRRNFWRQLREGK